MISLDYMIGGNSIRNYLISGGAFLLSLVILRFIKFVVVKRLKSLSIKTKNKLDDLIVGIIDSIGWPIYVLGAVYIGLLLISAPKIVYSVLKYLGLLAIVFYLTKMLVSIVNYSSGQLLAKREEKAGTKIDPTMMRFMANIVKAIIWLAALLVLLQNLGIQITSLIAGLGIGGLAIAFALQNILSDIFASVSIYFDKPFEVGDFIVIGNDSGTVEHIGVKSTRIKTLKGQELIVSNQELTSARVNNYKKMKKRRVVFTIGVTYSTSSKTLKEIPLIIKSIFKQIKHAELNRVHFAEFGDSSLQFEVVYFVDSKDYEVYMDSKQEVFLALKREFDQQKIEFAFPTQTIFLEK